MVSRIKTILVLCLCFLRLIFHGKAKKISSSPKKVVVAQIAQLGDMVCTTPVFRAIKSKYPDCIVKVVGRNQINKDLLSHNPDIDEYILHAKDFFSFVRRIKGEGFDAGFIVVPNFWVLAAFYLAGIPCIVATHLKGNSSPSQTKAYTLIHRCAIDSPLFYGQYFPRQYLRVLEPIGIMSEDTSKHLGFSNEARDKVDRLISGHYVSGQLIIGISPSAGNKIKNWPADRFAQLADYLYERHNALVIVTGAGSDGEEVEEMLRHIKPTTKVLNTLDILSTNELKALISRMNLFIAVDTGPIYIAEAFDVPTIDIIGPIDELEQPPIGPLNRIIMSPLRREPSIHLPEMHVMNARGYDMVEARRQVESISIDRVIEELEDLIKNLPKPQL